MWSFLDLIARVACAGAFVVAGFSVYQLTREVSARACVACGYSLGHFDIATCERCLDPELVNECEICAGGRAYPVSGQWCENLRIHATIAARQNSKVAR